MKPKSIVRNPKFWWKISSFWCEFTLRTFSQCERAWVCIKTIVVFLVTDYVLIILIRMFIQIKSYLFQAFAQYFNRTIKESTRVCVDDDPITFLPPFPWFTVISTKDLFSFIRSIWWIRFLVYSRHTLSDTFLTYLEWHIFP